MPYSKNQFRAANILTQTNLVGLVNPTAAFQVETEAAAGNRPANNGMLAALNFGNDLFTIKLPTALLVDLALIMNEPLFKPTGKVRLQQYLTPDDINYLNQIQKRVQTGYAKELIKLIIASNVIPD